MTSVRAASWLSVLAVPILAGAIASGARAVEHPLEDGIETTVDLEAPEEEVLPGDLRIIEANSLLDDAGSYDRAIALYREVLEDDPQDVDARHWLARVLSWRGDIEASLAEYASLLGRDPIPRDVEVETAEVLSWAGRYDEAMQAFDRLLARNPSDPRATLGKARVYAWSGRSAEAADAYAKALALEDDTEARRELASLNAGLARAGDAHSRYLSDSDGFSIVDVTSNATADLTLATRFIGTASYTDVGRDRDVFSEFSPFLPTSTSGVSGLVGLQHQVGAGVVASAEIGYRWWDAAPGHLLARGIVDYSLPTDTALGLELFYGDFLTNSDSFAAVLFALDETSLRGRVWQGFAHGLSAFAYLQGGFISDGNRRIAVGSSGEYQPFDDFPLTLGVAFDYLTFTERSILYYDPEIDVGGALTLQSQLPLAKWMSFGVEAAVGFGYASEGGLSGSGLTYSIGGGPTVAYGGLALTLFAGRSQSQRAQTYTAHTFGASVALEF